MSWPPFRVGALEKITGYDPHKAEDVAQAWADLIESLQDLERMCEDWYRRMQFGPLRGAYIPLHFRSDDNPLIGTSNDFGAIPVPCRPIAFECASQGSGVYTVSLYDGAGTQILNQQCATPHDVFRKRGDFDIDKLEPGRSSLTVDSIDGGTPEKLRAVLWVKAMDQLEDV